MSAPDICLLCPQIPQNTGTIGRLALACGVRLHLIKPLAFDISEKAVRRAGLDYWKYLDLRIHEDWEAFLCHTGGIDDLAFLSTRGEKIYTQIPLKARFLVFGSETTGLPPPFYETYRQHLYKIPILDPRVRSLNLANSAAVIIYDQLRQRGEGSLG